MTQNISQNSQSSFNDSPYSAKGRFGRLSYLAWLFITSVLYSSALMIVLLLGMITIATHGTSITSIGEFLSTALGIMTTLFFIIVMIGAVVLSLIVCIRRLHDLNKSGWLCLIFLIPIINVIFGLYLMLAPGTKGENNYGPVRITEQTEKLIGILYCILLASSLVLYAGLMTYAAALYPQLTELQQQTQIENQPDHIEQDSDDIHEISASQATI